MSWLWIEIKYKIQRAYILYLSVQFNLRNVFIYYFLFAVTSNYKHGYKHATEKIICIKIISQLAPNVPVRENTVFLLFLRDVPDALFFI